MAEEKGWFIPLKDWSPWALDYRPIKSVSSKRFACPFIDQSWLKVMDPLMWLYILSFGIHFCMNFRPVSSKQQGRKQTTPTTITTQTKLGTTEMESWHNARVLTATKVKGILSKEYFLKQTALFNFTHATGQEEKMMKTLQQFLLTDNVGVEFFNCNSLYFTVHYPYPNLYRKLWWKGTKKAWFTA